METLRKWDRMMLNNVDLCPKLMGHDEVKFLVKEALNGALRAIVEEMQRRDGGTTEEGYKPEEHHDTEEEYQWAHGYDTAQKEWITELEQARSELLQQQTTHE